MWRYSCEVPRMCIMKVGEGVISVCPAVATFESAKGLKSR